MGASPVASHGEGELGSVRLIVPGVFMVERLVECGDCGDAGDAVSTEPCTAAVLVLHTLPLVGIVACTLVTASVGSYTTASRSITPES